MAVDAGLGLFMLAFLLFQVPLVRRHLADFGVRLSGLSMLLLDLADLVASAGVLAPVGLIVLLALDAAILYALASSESRRWPAWLWVLGTKVIGLAVVASVVGGLWLGLPDLTK